MIDDPIRPIVGIYKNVTIEFCFGMGPDGDEYPFAATFERLADGRIDASKLVTGYAGSKASTRCSSTCARATTATSTT